MIELDIKDIVDSSLVKVYLKESIAEVERLPVYSDNMMATANELGEDLLYFDWIGRLRSALFTFGLRSNITLNLSRAVSYLRRLF